MRKESREVAFKIIYETLFNKDADIENSFSFLFEDAGITDEKDKQFSLQVFETYVKNKTEIEEKIKKHIIGYEQNRTYKIDLALICLTIAEIDYIKTPKAIVINEAVELAKIYSTEKSPSFVNGLLSSMYKE